MNKNLNLVDILKDCPKGYKLYSIIFGEVEFERIQTEYNTDYPIIFKYKDKDGDITIDSVTIDGKFAPYAIGECILFPSKDQRDWSKFKVEPELVDGEFYYCSSNLTEDGFIFIYEKHMSYKTKCYAAISIPSFVLFKNDIITNNENITKLRKATEEEKQQLLDAVKVRNYEWDADKKELIEIEPELVDGEIYYVKNDLVEWIFIYKRTYTFKTSHYVAVLNNDFNYYMEFNNICTTHNEDIKVLRKATEEEKRMLFKIIEENGRKWDADKKELVRIEKKFDLSTLQPFDKVLVRDVDTEKWKCDFYDSYEKEIKCPFRTTYTWYKQCIPYNDETKHLVATTKTPPEKYINWEE